MPSEKGDMEVKMKWQYYYYFITINNVADIFTATTIVNTSIILIYEN